MTPREQLLDRVFDQLQEDMRNGDFTAVEELLSNLPDDVLKAYLPEVSADE